VLGLAGQHRPPAARAPQRPGSASQTRRGLGLGDTGSSARLSPRPGPTPDWGRGYEGGGDLPHRVPHRPGRPARTWWWRQGKGGPARGDGVTRSGGAGGGRGCPVAGAARARRGTRPRTGSSHPRGQCPLPGPRAPAAARLLPLSRAARGARPRRRRLRLAGCSEAGRRQ
jgi:hypothetical protein